MQERETTRRRLLAGLGSVALIIITGCIEKEESEATGTATPTESTTQVSISTETVERTTELPDPTTTSSIPELQINSVDVSTGGVILEVENTGSQTVKLDKYDIRVELFNTENQLIGTASTKLQNTSVEGGSTKTIDLVAPGSTSDVARYEAHVECLPESNTYCD